jgi:uncharacterized protein (DUF2384 family)
MIETLVTVETIKSLVRKGLVALGTLLVAKNVVNDHEVKAVLDMIPDSAMDQIAGWAMIAWSSLWGALSHKKK